MNTITTKISATALTLMAFGLLAGCSGNEPEIVTDWERQLAERDDTITELRTNLSAQNQQIGDLQAAVSSAKEAEERAYAEMERLRTADATAAGSLFPPASPGECYARVFVPARYEQVSEQVMVRGATSEVKVIPASYEWVEEQVLVEPASYRLEETKAEYEWSEEKVLVKEAHTVWKKGRGPVEKIDSSTGEIMCLVQVPAEYKTVRKQVEVRPAGTKQVEIPAKYETVKVRKVVQPAREERATIPAEYQTVTRWVKLDDGRMEWREVVCETNLGGDLVRRMQVALNDKGHNPGPIDGIIGPQTMAALQSFQKSQGMAVGGITMNTLKRLGVTPN